MIVDIEITEYLPEIGIHTEWECDFSIITRVDDEGNIIIQANRPGLISLARHLLTLAQASVPERCHIHYDELNSLEDGSNELIIEKL